MKTIPSRVFLCWAGAGTLAALGVLVFPAAWLPLLAFDVALMLVALVDLLVTPGAAALDATRLLAERISALNPQPVTIRISNRSRVFLSVRLRDTIPKSFATTAEDLRGVVPPRGELRLSYEITPRTRGRFTWGAIHFRYRSLLRLWERHKTIEATADTRVYPSLAALARYHLLARASRLDVLGIRKVRVRGAAWEFESLRDYSPGDDVRMIDWKASARRRKIIVRNQEAERNQTVILLIDSGRLMNAEIDGVAMLDHAVNTALILAHVALARGDRVGLCSFSHKVHTWVSPHGRRGQMHLLTEALYNLRGDYTESDHGRCLRLLAARHPRRSLLVMLTDFVDAETAAEMVAYLQRAARRHLVLFAALKDPLLEQAAYSRPARALDGFRKAAATELLHERREVLERIRQMGAHVLDVEPSGLTPPVINRYLEVAFRGLL
jgi:uncharacterized protein (DUF58 family)